MRTRAAHIVCGVAAMAICLLLTACGQAVTADANDDAKASDRPYQGPVVTITQIEPEESTAKDRRRTDGNAKKSDHDVLSTCLGTIAEKVADDHGNPLVKKETVQDIFTFTIEDEEFELPCPITTFLDKEWNFEQGYSFADMSYDPGFSFEVGLWYKYDDNFNITVKLMNTKDEIAEWKDLTVVGLTLRPLDSFVSLESKIGVDRDSNLDWLLAVLGGNDESALLQNKTIVEYHVSLYAKPFYDMNASLYANIVYDWNKVGKAMTCISFELLSPWNVDLRKTDEELAKEAEEKAESGEDAEDPTAGVGRTIEGV